MNLHRIAVPLLILGLLAMAWRQLGWPGVAAVGGGLVMWLLLHVTRLMRVMKRAADRPVGQVDSAVMLNARLQPGLNLMQVIALTRALGERLGVEDEEPERWRWTDTGGSSVTVRLTGGRVTGWDLHRPAPES
ncbi:MAG: glycerate kinase [Hydrogenophaga sp.]|nr:glycerate kinase [Hydrogenophaga sp.]